MRLLLSLALAVALAQVVPVEDLLVSAYRTVTRPSVATRDGWTLVRPEGWQTWRGGFIGLSAAYEKGWNFRDTVGGCTDPANTTYVLEDDTGATTRNGVTFNWSATQTPVENYTASLPCELYGYHYLAGTPVFNITLPNTGDVTVTMGWGTGGAASTHRQTFNDDATTVATCTPDSGVELCDANGNEFPFLDWASMDTTRAMTFSTTAFTMTGSVDGGSDYTRVSHLYLSNASGGGATCGGSLLGVGC